MEKLPVQYLAELHAKNLRYSLLVNGIEVSQFADQTADVFSARLNIWLKNGRNPVRAIFQRTEGGAPSSILKITAMDADRNASEIFDSGQTSAGPIDYAIVVEQETGTVLDRLATVASVSTESPAILAVVTALHAALTGRDFERMIELQQVQMEEKSAAVGLSLSRSLEGYREYVHALWNEGRFNIAPLNAIVRETAFPGLVQVVDRGGGPAITASNGEARLSINPYLAKISGQWQIVR